MQAKVHSLQGRLVFEEYNGDVIEYTPLREGSGHKERVPYYSVRVNDELVGIVTEKYRPVQVKPLIEGLVNELNNVEVVQKWGGKGIMYYYVLLKDYQLDKMTYEDELPPEVIENLDYDYDENKDVTYPAIILSNSYNGATPFFEEWGIYRLVCENGLVIGDVAEKKNFIHIGDKIETEQIQVAKTVNFFKLLTDTSIKVSGEDLIEIVKEINVPKKLMKNVIEPIAQYRDYVTLMTVAGVMSWIMRYSKSIWNWSTEWLKAQRKFMKALSARVPFPQQ